MLRTQKIPFRKNWAGWTGFHPPSGRTLSLSASLFENMQYDKDVHICHQDPGKIKGAKYRGETASPHLNFKQNPVQESF